MPELPDKQKQFRDEWPSVEQRIADAVAAERRACAEIADEYDGEGMDSRGYEAQLGDARRTATDIRDSIMVRGLKLK